MRFEIKTERTHDTNMVDYRVLAFEGDDKVAAFFAQRVDPTKGYLSVLQQIAEQAPNCCNDFAVTHARWEKEGMPYKRRMSEWKAYCPHHLGIGFPAYHVGFGPEPSPIPGGAEHKHHTAERLFECTYCGCVFPESRGQECDSR